MTSKNGDVYRLVGRATEGAGYILEPWEKKVTFEEFEEKQNVPHWQKPDVEKVGYYFVCVDTIQEGSMTAPGICGVFIPLGIDKKKVADSLRRYWGTATELLKEKVNTTIHSTIL